MSETGLSRGHRQPAQLPPLSIVIPTHEGSVDWLFECLTGIVQQESDVVPEVLVVFDGEAPKAQELTRSVLPAARQVHLGKQKGFATAATAGLRAAKGGLIALVNDDAVLQPDWIDAVLDAEERFPNAGSFACRVLRADNPEIIDSAGHGLTRWGEAFAIGQGLRDGPPFDIEREVFGAPASAAIYRRELIRDTGGLDTKLEAYLEDIDLSLRAQSMGFPCMYLPQAHVLHRGASSYGWGTPEGGRAERMAARNRIRVLTRSMPRSTLLASGPAAIVAIAADLVQRALRRKRPLSSLAGTVEGLLSIPASIRERPATLGGRRVDDSWIRRVLLESEEQMAALTKSDDAGQWRRTRGTLARVLATWVDRRELRHRTPHF